MRIYKSKWFAKFARKNRITAGKLIEAVRNADQGLIDADYGGGVIKQRIARPQAGKSGGYISIILFRKGERSIFVYGFAKNDLDNIDESDEREFRALAMILLNLRTEEFEKLINQGKYMEVQTNDQSKEL